jgi:hypothetical protein
VGGNGVIFFAMGKKNLKNLLKVSNLACQPYLCIFPLKLPLGQFPPRKYQDLLARQNLKILWRRCGFNKNRFWSIN